MRLQRIFIGHDLDGATEKLITVKWVHQSCGTIFARPRFGRNIISNFQHFTNPFLTPNFSADLSEVTFSINAGGDDSLPHVKISKGEESNFIWCVFYSLVEQVVEILNTPEPEDRPTNQFDSLKYIVIDDPVSSLDDNHLIELAVNLAETVIKSTNLEFIISTHNPLFYNVLFNELGSKACYMLNKLEDGLTI